MNEHKLNRIELEEHFKSYMENLDHCECDDPECERPPAGKPHHGFRQSKLNRKLYPEFIDDYINLFGMSDFCHANRKKHLSEIEFCNRINEKYPGLNIKPRSKSGIEYYKRRTS